MRQNLLCRVALQVRDGEQQVLGRNVFVLEVGGFFEGLLEQLVGFVGERGLRSFARNFGQLFDLAVDIAQDGLRADADLFQNRRNDAFLIFEQRSEQMNRLQLGIAVLGGELARALDGFLRFNGKFVPTDGHEEPRFT